MSYENMSKEEMMAMIEEQQRLLAEHPKKKEKKVKAPPPPPPPYERVVAVFDKDDEGQNVDCIVEADFLEYVEGLDKGGLKATINNLLEDLKHVSGYCVNDDIAVISFRPEMVRKKKGGGAGAGGPRKVIVHSEPEYQCEAAVWNKGAGDRCNYLFVAEGKLDCGRKVCKSHKNAIDAFCAVMETPEDEGHLIGWFDNFNRARHDQYNKTYVAKRKTARVGSDGAPSKKKTTKKTTKKTNYLEELEAELKSKPAVEVEETKEEVDIEAIQATMEALFVETEEVEETKEEEYVPYQRSADHPSEIKKKKKEEEAKKPKKKRRTKAEMALAKKD